MRPASNCLFNIDTPLAGMTGSQTSPLMVSGWFLDAKGQPARQVIATCGAESAICQVVNRPDVVNAHGHRWLIQPGVGFSAQFDPPAGTVEIAVFAEMLDGDTAELCRLQLDVTASPVVIAPHQALAPPLAPAADVPVPLLAAEGRVVVSVLFYFREDLIYRCIDSLMPQLAHLAARHRGPITLVAVLNYAAAPEVVVKMKAHIARIRPDLPALHVELDEPGHNLGFGGGHNRVFTRHPSDLFVMVNSDVRMKQADWLDHVVALFSRQSTAYAGLAATAARLRSDGCGIEAPDPQRNGFDFVDGSLLAVNSATAGRLGLFAESYRYFYFEDADLGLRYRQAGLEPVLLDLEYHHDRYSSTSLLPRSVVEGVLDHNRARFFEAWEPFLAHRTLSRRLRVGLDEADATHQCAALPALFGLLADHPAADLYLTGVHPALRPLFRHPRFHLQTPDTIEPTGGYFSTLFLTGRLTATVPLVDAICAEFKTEGDLAAARAHLIKLAETTGPNPPAPTAMVIAAGGTPHFQGRHLDPVLLDAAVVLLRKRGRVAIYSELPRYSHPATWLVTQSLNQDTLLPLLQDLRHLPLVVTTDHWVLQLAQLVGAPCFGWFGSTAPRSRIINWSNSGSFVAPSLECVGCSHVLGSRDENACVRTDLACTNARWLPDFLDQLEAFANHPRSPAWLESAWATVPLAGRRRSSPEMDFSKWRRSLIERVLVMIPVKPGLSAASLARCQALAERAIRDLPKSRIVLDNKGEAPPRGSHPYRQAALAAIRQGMIDRHLADEHWVFWLDADIVDLSEDLLVKLIHRAEGGIAAPLVIMEGDIRQPLANSHGFGPGRFFDVAGFVEKSRWASFTLPYFAQPGPAIDLESVGSCYVVNAELYRRGARHEADSLAQAFVAAGRTWPDNAIALGQSGQPLAFTEHYSVCAFARAQGLPVRAHADLVAWHERVG